MQYDKKLELTEKALACCVVILSCAKLRMLKEGASTDDAHFIKINQALEKVQKELNNV